MHYEAMVYSYDRFNTQPPEGGWDGIDILWCRCDVSTHSRPKAAGIEQARIIAA